MDVVWKYECQGRLAAVLEELSEALKHSWKVESVSIMPIEDPDDWFALWQGIIYYTEEEEEEEDESS